MISTRQPIRTTILHVRSKDALQLDQTLNTNFSIQLSSAVTASADEEIHAQMISAEIPYSCYNISPSVKNNTIVFNTNQTFTLPPKNYDDVELVRVINAEASFPFSVTHDIYTNKLTFTNTSGVTAVINWTSSLANKLLGYGEAVDETILSGATTVSPGMLDLATIHSFFIKSDLASGNVLSTRAGNSTTLQKISVDMNGYGIIYLNQQDYRTVSVLQKPSISNITFRMTDQNDNLVDLNDINYEFSIQFMVFRRPRTETLTTPPNRRASQPIQEQPIAQPMVQGNSLEIIDDVVEENANDTHPIDGNTEIEKVAEKTILDAIIDNL